MSKFHESKSDGLTDRNGLNIKTLYIKSLAVELKRDEIHNHFSVYGDVKNVRNCTFVEFTEAESAAKALAVDFHTIAGHRIEITVADDGRVQTTFLDLNDDCIHEILSSECLSAMDLCSMAETRPRLKSIADRVFSRKHAEFVISSLNNSEAASVKRIIMNFGSLITDLKIGRDRFYDRQTSVLDYMAQHCSNKLRSLCLQRCVVSGNLVAELRPMFDNLQKLTLRHCRFEDAGRQLFAACRSLIELKLIDDDYVGCVVVNTFPKLKKFKFYCAGCAAELDTFILRHSNLTSIEIRRHHEMAFLLLLIGDNCKRHEELTFSIQGFETYDISKLGHIRKLHIYCFDQTVGSSVRGWDNLQFLEHLTLNEAKVNYEFIKILSQLKGLEVLRLMECSRISDWNKLGKLNQLTELEISSKLKIIVDFVLLIERLSNLKTLSVTVSDEDFKIDPETYSRIVAVIQARPDESQLTFNLHYKQYDANMCHDFSSDAHTVEMVFP